MTENQASLSAHWSDVDFSPRQLPDRIRLECLRLSADIGGTEGEILSRAHRFVDFIASAPATTVESRWISLRMAAHSLDQPTDGAAIIEAAHSYENFILCRDSPTPAPFP